MASNPEPPPADPNDLAFSIGRYVLRDSYGNDPTRVWLERDGGEGGDFDIALLETALDAFFDAHF